MGIPVSAAEQIGLMAMTLIILAMICVVGMVLYDLNQEGRQSRQRLIDNDEEVL